MLYSFRPPGEPFWFGVVARSIRQQIEAGETPQQIEKVTLPLVKAGHTSLVACLGLEQRDDGAILRQAILDIATVTKRRPVDWDLAFRGDRKTFVKFVTWLQDRRELLAIK